MVVPFQLENNVRDLLTRPIHKLKGLIMVSPLPHGEAELAPVKTGGERDKTVAPSPNLSPKGRGIFSNGG